MKQAKSNSNRQNLEYGGFQIDPGFGLWKMDMSNTRDWKSEVFPIDRNQITGVGWMLEVTRGRVDNENNIKVDIRTSNIVQGGGLYIRVREHSH